MLFIFGHGRVGTIMERAVQTKHWKRAFPSSPLREEKLKMEPAFLKSQVNPHFPFNTLNNLFASAKRSKDKYTAEGISKLSGLMRYSLYEANVSKVPLQKKNRLHSQLH